MKRCQEQSNLGEAIPVHDPSLNAASGIDPSLPAELNASIQALNDRVRPFCDCILHALHGHADKLCHSREGEHNGMSQSSTLLAWIPACLSLLTQSLFHPGLGTSQSLSPPPPPPPLPCRGVGSFVTPAQGLFQLGATTRLLVFFGVAGPKTVQCYS